LPPGSAAVNKADTVVQLQNTCPTVEEYKKIIENEKNAASLLKLAQLFFPMNGGQFLGFDDQATNATTLVLLARMEELDAKQVASLGAELPQLINEAKAEIANDNKASMVLVVDGMTGNAAAQFNKVEKETGKILSNTNPQRMIRLNEATVKSLTEKARGFGRQGENKILSLEIKAKAQCTAVP
jgi:hypothetical protein